MFLGFIVTHLLIFKTTSSESIEQKESVNEEARLMPNPCIQPKDPGPCKAHFRRFYYDAKEGKCFPFTYGGYYGNMNRFTTIKECNQRCAGGSGLKTCGKTRQVCL